MFAFRLTCSERHDSTAVFSTQLLNLFDALSFHRSNLISVQFVGTKPNGPVAIGGFHLTPQSDTLGRPS